MDAQRALSATLKAGGGEEKEGEDDDEDGEEKDKTARKNSRPPNLNEQLWLLSSSKRPYKALPGLCGPADSSQGQINQGPSAAVDHEPTVEGGNMGVTGA